MKNLLILSLAMFSLNLHAALVDQGYVTLDTDTGLKWLDTSFTKGYGYDEAVSIGEASVYRAATWNEVESLYVRYQYEISTLESYFTGWTVSLDFIPVNGFFGMYRSEDGSLMTLYSFLDGGIYGLNTVDWVVGQGVPESDFSSLMVVNEVPVPAAGWLFMSALLGLMGRKRLSRR